MFTLFFYLQGGTPSTKNDEYYNGNISWITPKDLSNYKYRYISKGERAITELGLQKSSAKLTPKGTVLLTTRAPIGYVAISQNDICTNQGFKSLVPKKGKSVSEFLYYLLKANTHYLKQNSSGSTFGEISGNIVKSLEFCFPPLHIQHRIAEILGALDDKIELNLQMNKSLEEMTMALYKHWFVDFGPFKDGEFVESKLGPIPKWWKVELLNNVVRIGKKSIKPFEYPNKTFLHYSIPAFYEFSYPKTELGKEIASNKTVIESDTILISKLNPRIKRI